MTPSRAHHHDLRLGVCVWIEHAERLIPQLLPLGFESFQLICGPRIRDKGDLVELASRLDGLLAGRAVISGLGLYANVLTDEEARADLATAIRSASLFGANLVGCFTGALEDRPVDESLPLFGEVFSELARLAEDEGARLAFENCAMGGTWERPRVNIAHSPRAWEMLFNVVPSPALGLEWEPCHQLESFADPIAQLWKWSDRIYHVHGKDGSRWAAPMAEYGVRGGVPTFHHRFPGFGDTRWEDVLSILRLQGWTGCCDIEGHHDPVLCGDLEWTGAAASLEYLKRCRGGDYVAVTV